MSELIEPNSGNNQNNLAAGCHLLGFLIFVIPGIGQILGPLALWALKREGHPFVDEHGKEALNFQISFTLWYLIGSALIAVLFWTLVVPVVVGLALVVLSAIWIVTMILAASYACHGQSFRYPLTWRLIS